MLNTALGLAVESANAAVEVMLMPSLILAFFVAELTPAYTTIGLVPAIAVSFWTLARLPAGLLTNGRRRRQPWAFGAAAARAGAILILAVVAIRTNPNDLALAARPLLGTLFLCLIVYSLAGGFASVPTAALLRASAGGEGWPAFVGRRAIWATVLSLLGGFIVWRVLGANALAFPNSYGRLFLVAAVVLTAVAVFTAAMREPSGGAVRFEPAVSPRSWRQPFANPRFRRLIVFRGLLAATAAIDPFLFLYAVTRLGVPLSAIGGYALAGVLGWIASAPLWLWLERRSGPRSVLQGAAVVRLVAPAIALVVPQLDGIAQLQSEGGIDPRLNFLYGAAFFAIGAALAALSRGGFDYQAAVLARPLLPSATLITNAVLAVFAFAPVVGGLMIQRFGYETLFGAAAVLGLAAVFAGGQLPASPAVAWEATNAGRAASPYRALPAPRL